MKALIIEKLYQLISKLRLGVLDSELRMLRTDVTLLVVVTGSGQASEIDAEPKICR